MSFCPNSLSERRIRVVECTESDENEQLGFFLEELDLLHQSSPMDISTTIIAYPEGSSDFQEFNDFVGDLESMLEEAELADVFQLVALPSKICFR